MAANDTGASCVAIAKTLCVLDTAFYLGSRKFERLPSQESNPMSTININPDTASIRGESFQAGPAVSAAWRIGRVKEETVASTRRQEHLGPEGDVSSQRSLSSQRPTGEFLYITMFRTRLDFKTIVPSDHSIYTRCNP
jgi:hypothetical protein